MQEPRLVPPEDVSHLKPQKKKPLNQVASAIQKKGEINRSKEALYQSVKTKKGIKRALNSNASPPFQKIDATTSDSLLDPSLSGSNYRALRHKYLMLEEESSSLDRELNEAVEEVKSLEDEKFALLDQLVVFEGLIDPSELRPKGGL